MTLIGILAILLVVTAISSQSYVKKASALFTPMHGIGSCPAGKVRDWAGICFNKSEAKACITCAPGSAAPAEKPESTAAEKHEANKEVEKSTGAEKPEASTQVEANKEVEGTKIKQQQLGRSQIKVENPEIGADVLHTRESALQHAAASQAKVEHAPTNRNEAKVEHTTTIGGLLGNAHLGTPFKVNSEGLLPKKTEWTQKKLIPGHKEDGNCLYAETTIRTNARSTGHTVWDKCP
jgi:hypothetical protein